VVLILLLRPCSGRYPDPHRARQLLREPGATSFAFFHLFNFAGVDATLPLLGFLFLVAFGVDYNIF